LCHRSWPSIERCAREQRSHDIPCVELGHQLGRVDRLGSRRLTHDPEAGAADHQGSDQHAGYEPEHLSAD
jgi:hypothetical protein